MLLDWINCLLESTMYLEIFLFFSSYIPSKRQLLLYYLLSNLSAAFFVLVPMHILPLNMLFFCVVVCISFREDELNVRIYHSLVTFLGCIIFQFTLFAFLPTHFLQTNSGNFIGNIAIVLITGSLLIYIRRKNVKSSLDAFVWQFRIVLLILLVCFLLLGQFYLSRLMHLWTALPGLIALLVLLLLVASIIVYVHYQQSFDRMQAELFRQSLQNSQTLVETMRIQLHDYKHHLQHLQNMISSSTDIKELQDESSDYLNLLQQDRSMYELLLSMENPVIRAFLFGCYDRCNKQGIPLYIESTNILPSFPLKDYQFVEVIENLLTNAVEHNMTLDAASRYIRICLQYKDGTNLFSIENPALNISRPLEELYIAYATTKGNDHQGLGLTSIQNILSQYGMSLVGKRIPETNSVIFSFSYRAGDNS